MAGNHPDAAALRAAFDEPAPMTVGVEDELLVVDAATLELAPRGAELADGARFEEELPAAQVEIRLPPLAGAAEVAGALTGARRDLAARAAERGLRLAGAAVHPLAEPIGIESPHPRYRPSLEEFGDVVRVQQVSALQVHVAVRGAARALAVHNALRSYLPELAALAANAPFLAGRDTGLASCRPKIGDLLPRQGVPPAIPSWDWLAAAIAWQPNAGRWWWEVSPRPAFGTLEVRVPDTQITVRDSAAVVAVVHALVAWLAARHDDGGPLPCHDTWRIEENRWSACRWGVEGHLADLDTGRRHHARDRLHGLLDELVAFAREQGGGEQLEDARALVERNGAMRQRAVAGEQGLPGLVAWLADACTG